MHQVIQQKRRTKVDRYREAYAMPYHTFTTIRTINRVTTKGEGEGYFASEIKALSVNGIFFGPS